ncbi:RHH-type transcriptional regulator, proline utilization regulon repressor / proline dehydrogenase / delta 1-pyrroline-5-carboxylate dehydrogenase [Candidatus Magnetomoraceae bacterium gMMP-15]
MLKQQRDKILKEAIDLAETWQNQANELLTSEEKLIQGQMKRLLSHSIDKIILIKMLDQSFRSVSTKRVAAQINNILQQYGIPKFFSFYERLLAYLFVHAGRHFHSISIPQMVEKIRKNSSQAIIPGEKKIFYPHLKKRKNEGVRMNINHLGEAVLGENEALSRLNMYIKDLENPDIECISVKISSIYSQIQSLAFDHNVSIIKNRLSSLFRTASKHFFVRHDRVSVPKFVNLDMEEYRDVEITTTAFMLALDQKDLKNHSACIALQSYLPDSYDIQKELTTWAKNRVADGGSPVKIRIVKGANMEMELLESALHNWPLAPYDNKLDVDANYKRMVEFGMKAENIKAVQLGIASHNLFDMAYAYRLAQKNNVVKYITFEMLEGMADHLRRAIQEVSKDILLYAPVAARDQFINAIAYLVRRLDENTGKENFLRYSFDLKVGSSKWEFLKDQFITSYYYKNKPGTKPHRIQNRLEESFSEETGTYYENEFNNEADTDWSLAQNRKWAENIRKKWKKSSENTPFEIPIVVQNTEIYENREIKKCINLSEFNEKNCISNSCIANDQDIEKAVLTAKNDPDGWRNKTFAERHKILSKAAKLIRISRSNLIGSAAAGTGKIFGEADGEVSEAIDFTEFYPYSAQAFADLKNIECSGRGVGLVISPWNFPIAIPCGGIAAALSAGNTVIFKPSSDSILTAWELCQCFWKAGISKNVLQFLPCNGETTGKKLVNHPDVDFIIFTGGTDTGLNILKQRPEILLAAETGGKNATIITAMADRDQAIKNVIHSAFSNSGQKCSATSLLILEKEVYEDENFKKQLVDAVKSYSTGSAWDFKNKMSNLIRPPGPNLKRALTQLEPGESWALKPKNINNNPYMWTPGIKWGVSQGSYTHLTEFFGPVLGVMKAEDLDHAIELTNQTCYGLTSGLESLDEHEHKYWKEHIKAGNLYINRVTTGAIVLRQPFGGMCKSALGAGIKAGGPNYVSQFMNFKEIKAPTIGAIQKDYQLLRLAQEWKQKLNWHGFKDFESDIKKTILAIKSCLYHAEQEFFKEKDYFHLRGQDNIVRYLPVGRLIIRLHEADSLFETLVRIAAARISECKPIISLPPDLNNNITQFLAGREGKKIIGDLPIKYQTDSALIKFIPKIDRIRYAAQDRVPYKVFEVAAKTGFYISRARVMMEGRIELLQYFREQSISYNYHRYGNLGERGEILSAEGASACSLRL